MEGGDSESPGTGDLNSICLFHQTIKLACPFSHRNSQLIVKSYVYVQWLVHAQQCNQNLLLNGCV